MLSNGRTIAIKHEDGSRRTIKYNYGVMNVIKVVLQYGGLSQG